LKEALESTAIVDDDETTEADLQKDFLDEQTSKIVGSDVAGGVNKNEPGKIAHSVQEISFSTIISDVARRPKINMEDVKGATEGPRENELTVASDSAIGGDAMGTLKNPAGDVLATQRPEEAKANAMKSLVDTHVASRRRSVVSWKDVTTKGKRDDDQHEHLLVVLNGLKNDKFAIEKRDSVAADVIAKRSVESSKVELSEGRCRRETVEKKLSVGILGVSCGPIQRRRDRSSSRDGVDEGASDKLSGRVGGVDKSEEMDVDEMVDKMRAKLEGTAGWQEEAVIGRNGSGWKRSKNCWRGWVTGEQLWNGEGSDVGGAKTGGERKAESARETRRK
jgi:hypothetical protein